MLAMALYIPNFNLTRQQVGYVCFSGLIFPEHYDLMSNLLVVSACRMQQKHSFIFCLV